MRSESALRIAPAAGSISPRSRRSSVVLPLPFGPTRPTRIPAVMREIHIFRKVAAADVVGDGVEFDRALGLAFGGGEINLRGDGAGSAIQVREFADHAVGFIDARFRFRGARLGAAAQPFDFGAHAIFERVLMLALRVEIALPWLREMCCSSRSRAGRRRRRRD